MKTSDVGRLVADWQLQSAGYDVVNGRLTDRGPLGLHLPNTGSAPTYATYAGFEAMVLQGGPQFQLIPAPLPSIFTMVAVAHVKIASTSDTLNGFGEVLTYDNADVAWATPTGTKDGAGYTMGCSFNYNAVTHQFTTGGFISGAIASVTFTPDSLIVCQGVMNPRAGLAKARVNKGAVASAAVSNGFRASQYTERFLLAGNTGFTTTGGAHAAAMRWAIFNGDLFAENPSGLDALVDALTANPAGVGT